MKIASRYQCLALLLVGAFVLAGCQSSGSDASKDVSACEAVTEIEGEYSCTGECIVTDSAGNRSFAAVSGETDTVRRYPGADDLYQVNITGGNDFHELEIGALAGVTLRTATAEVSDGQFPVLEEYVFQTDPVCNALGITKIVRNPSPESFKSCAIRCEKSSP